MNLIQLKVFREVMESGSVSQTAKKLGRTQPAISAAIKKLEESLGLKLFERRGHQLVPVPEARYLMTEAAELLDRMSTVSATMKSLTNAESGNLNIAAMPGPSSYLFPRFISDAIGDSHDINISLSSRSSLQIQELASTQSIDFGFADRDQQDDRARAYSSDIIAANCFCALYREHPLAKKNQIDVSDLDGLPMGALQSNHSIYRRTIEAFQNAGSKFNKKIDSQIFLPLIQFVSAAQCLAIVDPLTVITERETDSSKGQVIFLPLRQPLRYEYAILTPLHRPPSQLSLKIKAGWLDELMKLLTEIGADPRTSPIE